MQDSGETLFQFISRNVELIKTREAELGAYPGDGPTATQADSLVSALRPLSEAVEPAAPSVMWEAFRSAVDTEMTWLFPERDPLGAPMTAALRQVQTTTGKLLEEVLPDQAETLHKYVNLAIVANAAARTEKLNGNGISWRLVLARALFWLGGGKRQN